MFAASVCAASMCAASICVCPLLTIFAASRAARVLWNGVRIIAQEDMK